MKLYPYLAVLLFTLIGLAQAQTTLRVATKPLTPFVMESTTSPSGVEGFSVDLWNTIATKNNWKTEFKSYKTVQEVLQAVQSGQADVGISGISITKEREAVLDFSGPMFNAGLQVLVPTRPAFDPIQSLKNLFSPQLLFIALLILLLIVVASHVIWLAHRRDPTFPKGYLRGVSEGI